MDPHQIENWDPDPDLHQSDKLDPDLPQSDKLDPHPHQFCR
jgi:hypothetical protein